MKNKKFIANFVFFLGIIIVFAGLALIFGYRSSDQASALDSFAQCLAEKRITMYGADWCPHCQNEKKEFGSSFRFVPYVECPKNPKLCLEAGINGYPTWIFSDGQRFEGEQGLERLSQESGCTLPIEADQH